MQRTFSRVLIATIGALLLVACDATEEADQTTTGTAEETEASEVDGSEEPDRAEDVAEGAETEEDGGDAAADPAGFVTIEGEEHELALVHNCEPRESSTLMDPRTPGSEVDGTIEFRTMALGVDEFAIDIWEQTTDGVRAQRLHSLNLLGMERSIVAEGDEEYPLFELDGDRVTVEALHQVDADEWVEVSAEWTIPNSYVDC
jgi:hypothetical protein